MILHRLEEMGEKKGLLFCKFQVNSLAQGDVGIVFPKQKTFTLFWLEHISSKKKGEKNNNTCVLSPAPTV